MADLSKFKRRSTLGAPPPITEASTNLDAPETLPVGSAVLPKPASSLAAEGGQGRRLRDGRSARRTGRTIQFATRVSPAFDERFRAIAERDGRCM